MEYSRHQQVPNTPVPFGFGCGRGSTALTEHHLLSVHGPVRAQAGPGAPSSGAG